jgi:hypothetical protein
MNDWERNPETTFDTVQSDDFWRGAPGGRDFFGTIATSASMP